MFCVVSPPMSAIFQCSISLCRVHCESSAKLVQRPFFLVSSSTRSFLQRPFSTLLLSQKFQKSHVKITCRTPLERMSEEKKTQNNSVCKIPFFCIVLRVLYISTNYISILNIISCKLQLFQLRTFFISFLGNTKSNSSTWHDIFSKSEKEVKFSFFWPSRK